VTAYSGGPAPAPSASPTAAGFVSASAHVSASAVTDIATAPTGTGTASIPIIVGSALPKKVLMSADPPYLTTSRQSAITANVFDGSGNPVRNVPVIFTVALTGTGDLRESLASGGSPQFTDSNGQAFDTLKTSTANGTTPKTARVTATVPTLDGAFVDVIVYYTTLR
jgi:hypothetical protein